MKIMNVKVKTVGMIVLAVAGTVFAVNNIPQLAQVVKGGPKNA